MSFSFSFSYPELKPIPLQFPAVDATIVYSARFKELTQNMSTVCKSPKQMCSAPPTLGSAFSDLVLTD
jgi:hypothetical protein